MTPHHFPDTLVRAIRQRSLTPDEFAREAHLTSFETAHMLAGEPLPHQDYRAVFQYFLMEPKRAHFASALARARLADALLESGLDEDSVARLSAPTERDASIVHLFRKLSVVQLLALSVIGHAATKNEGANDTLLVLAELCRTVAGDRTVSSGFFRQYITSPGEAEHLGGSAGATAAILARDAEE